MRWTLLPLLLTQGLWTARRTPRLAPAPGPVEGTIGHGAPRALLALGDSIIAGVGVGRSEEALPARLAAAVANRDGCTVHWRARGRNGARSRWLLEQLAATDSSGMTPDLVVISNGINDVTTLHSESAVLGQLRHVIATTEARYPQALVFQLALPPLGAFPALPQPLRSVLGARSDRINARLAAWLAERPRAHFLPFDGLPRADQFATDGYHPAAPAVALWAESLAAMISAHLPPGGAAVQAP